MPRTYSSVLFNKCYCADRNKDIQMSGACRMHKEIINLYDIWYICWTAIGLPPGSSSTVHIYTQTIRRTTQNKQYTEQHKNVWKSAGHTPSLYPGICLTTEEKARENLSQGNRRVPAGTMKIHKHTIRIQRHNNKNEKITVLNNIYRLGENVKG